MAGWIHEEGAQKLGAWLKAPALELLMPSLDLAVALRVIGRNPEVCHAADPDKLLKILGDKLGSVVRDYSGPCSGTFSFARC